MTWTLRRILIIIVLLSSLAVAGTLYWVTATYQEFAITNQHEVTASTVRHLIARQIEDEHRRKVNPFIDEWSRLSTLVQGMNQGDPEKARLAANRMMLTLEVAEGRVRLRNVVIYSTELETVAFADKGTGESLSTLPALLDRLRKRDKGEQRQIASFLWRGPDDRPLYSTVAPIGGFRVAGFVEFVSDPIPDLTGIGEGLRGRFRLLDVKGVPVFEENRGASDIVGASDDDLDTSFVPIADALGGTWAIATLTRDLSGFQTTVEQLRNQALVIVAAVMFGSVLIAWLMLRLSVFNRLKAFANVTRMLAQGRTDVAIPSVGKDELAVMRTSLLLLKTAVEERAKTSRALREGEQRLRAIIDNTPSSIYLKDTNGRITVANLTAARNVGVEPRELIGSTAYDYLPKNIADIMTAEETEVFQSGKIRERELELNSKARGPYVGLMVKFPVFDVHGIVTGVGTITSDISERKRTERELLAAREKAEEQAKLQRIILDNVGQGILVFDEDKKPVLWNDLATGFTGLSNEFLERRQTLEQCDAFQISEFAFDEKTVEVIGDFVRRVASGERDFVVTYQRRSIEGDSWVQVSLRSLSDGIIVQTYQDISELRQAIDAARRAQRLAEDANRAKSDFLSNMSHELRTPLNAIIGFTEFVLENDEEPITEEQSASLSQVLKAGRHLLLLINDVLDLSRIEAGAISLSIEPVDVGQIIDECISLTSSFAASRNIAVHNLLASEILPPVAVDRIRFKQVFLNLLSNAVKYNSDPGNVFIEAGPAKSGMQRIGIRDEGRGIAEDQIGKLFDPFDRLGAENSAIEGTGIGLTITKNLVEQMGGSISVDSTVGEGSTFWLELKLSETAAEHRVEASELETVPDKNLEGVVLYVEDNPANLELVRKIISLHPGLDFIEAATGELGIERARSELPDVILLDINLPGLDGFQVLEALSAIPETRHIPVIALTAAATEADIKRGQAAGFFSYLTKPIAARLLMTTIRRAMRPATPDAPDAPPLSPSGKVLVVDDMPINLAVAQRQLTKLGVTCDVVEDPVRALDMLKTGAYAVALVDIGLPVMNGMELTRRLRAAEQVSGTHTPVIALTANYGSEDDIGRYRKAGMDGQLSKPVNLDELASTLHRWFSLDSERSGKPAPASLAAHPTDYRPVDIDQFKEILGTDDAETIREMFDLFIALVPDELDNLSSAVAARDTRRAREAAHRFKSAAANAAARRLSDLLQKIEDEAEDGIWETLDRDLKLVREECDRVADFMRIEA